MRKTVIYLMIISAMLISSCNRIKEANRKQKEDMELLEQYKKAESDKKNMEEDASRLVELEVKYAALYDMDHYYDLQLIAIGAVDHIKNKNAYEAYKEYQNFGLDMKIKYSDRWEEFNTLYQAMSGKVLLEKGINGLLK